MGLDPGFRRGTAVLKLPLERHYRLWLLLVWLACAAIMIVVSADNIANWRFPDPDDVMRLDQVRDWMAGQSWFDVRQHRMNLPAGLSMHWSRLLDVPLAATIALFLPLIGAQAAETVAMVAVPMFTLGAVMALVAEITRRREGAPAALLAAACCILSIGAWYALRPLRIDHHGWQIVAGLGVVLALTARRDWRGAAIAGTCAGVWAHISLEGLPFAAGAAAWLGLRWIAMPAERLRLPAFLAALSATGTILHLAAHGAVGGPFCDQLSPIHLAVLGSATGISGVAAWLSPKPLPARIGALAVATILCAAHYRLAAPQCATGPFGTLGALGYRLWYSNVNEGVPIWHLPLPLMLLWGVFPVVGLIGAIVACRRPGASRDAAVDYCALLAIATAIGLLVTRAGAFANLLAIPGAIALILRAVAATEHWPMPARAIGRAAAILLLCPDGAGLAALLASPRAAAPSVPSTPASDPRCGLTAMLAPLDRMPPATIMAPLDLGPSLLAATHHRAATGPYHRDPAALEDVLRFFTSGEAGARAIARSRGTAYVAFCKTDGEMAGMAKFAPKGMAALLLHDRAPVWLRPVPLSGTAGLGLYRVIP